ncbi:MAG TPA: beta-galactosidase [Candidatus Hydrogenedentes bacterium]|nr:beta-galactosidase [Candidatus Hydrogenedentota bacterium]
MRNTGWLWISCMVMVTVPLGAFADTPASDKIPGRYVITDFSGESGFSGLGDDGRTLGPEGARHPRLSLFGEPEAIEIHIRQATPGSRVGMALVSHFQTFRRVSDPLSGGTQALVFPPPPDGWEHSGAEEQHVTYPLQLIELWLVPPESSPAPPVAVLDRIECATRISRDRQLVLWAEWAQSPVGSRRSMRIQAWNLAPEDVMGTLEIRQVDWEERPLNEPVSQAWMLPGGGACQELVFNVAIPDHLNFTEVLAQFRPNREDLPPVTGRVCHTRDLPDGGDTLLRPESPWGMGVYLYRYGPDDHDKVAAIARKAGVKWSREEFSWANTEIAPGQYDFNFYDSVVSAAHRNGISVYGLLCYWGRFTDPYTEKGIDDFCRWARAVVRHFKDRVKYWEIYNEPNIFFWSGPKELYPLLLKRCYAAIKEEDPDAHVLGCSTAGIDRNFIQQVLDAGAPFDILTIHPYRRDLNEDQFARELRRVAEQVGNRPAWITEMGWSTHAAGVSERSQATLLARSYLAAVWSGACQNMGWYDLRNDGSDPFVFEHNFGVLYQDFSPKPAFRTLASVCLTLGEGKPEPVPCKRDGVRALRSGTGAAVWSDQDMTARVICDRSPARAFNLMGEPIPIGRNSRTIVLSLRAGQPVFIVGASVKRVE